MVWTAQMQRWVCTLAFALTCVLFQNTASAQRGPRQAVNPQPSFGDSNAESAKLARQLWDWYGQASDLHDAGKLDEAWELYQKIWQHRHTYDVATSMGGISAHREQYAAAAHFYHIALQEMVPTQTPEFVASVTQEFERARSKTTEVSIDVHPPDLDDLVIEDIDRNVRVELPLYLVPGTTQLRASAEGYAPQTFTVDARPGLRVTWDLNFEHPNETPPPPPNTNAPDTRTETTRHPAVVFPIGGLLTAGLAVGAVLSFNLGERRYNQIQSTELSANACLGPRPAEDCARVQRLKREGERADALGLGLSLGAGAMALATLATWWLWESEVPVTVEAGISGAQVRWGYEF